MVKDYIIVDEIKLAEVQAETLLRLYEIGSEAGGIPEFVKEGIIQGFMIPREVLDRLDALCRANNPEGAARTDEINRSHAR